MGIQAPAEVKYGLIREAVRQDGNLLNISALCRIAGVSRSGYYAWLDAAPMRQSREEMDSRDFALVKQAYEFRGYKKGARRVISQILCKHRFRCKTEQNIFKAGAAEAVSALSTK